MGKLYSSKRKMRPKPIFMLVVGLLICWLSVWSAGVAIGSQPVQGEAGVDLLLLVDASDSMKVLDRDRLADQIARSVLRYLVEDVPGDTTSRVGIFCFSDKMTPLLKLTPLSEVELEQVSVECERGGGTLFAKILEEVPSVFRAEPRPENRKVILLITDGHPSYSGESVLVEDEVNRNYLLGNVVPKISALQELDEKPTLHVIGVGETKFVDFWSQYNFTRVEDSDHLLRIGALLAELFPVAPPPSPTLTPAFTPSPSPSPTFTLAPPTSTPSPSPVPTSTPAPTSTPSPSLTWTPSPSATPSPTPSPLATFTVVVQVTPTAPTLTVTPTSTVTPTPPSRRSIIGVVGPNANLGVGLVGGGLFGLILVLVLYSRRRVLIPAAPFEVDRKEIENNRKEARRLISAGKWAEAETRLKEALEKAGLLFERTTEFVTDFVTDIAAGPVNDLLYAVDRTDQARQERIAELAKDPKEHVRRGLARVLRTKRWRGDRDLALRDIYDMLDAGGNPDVLQFAAQGDGNPVARLCQALYELMVAEKQIDAIGDKLDGLIAALAD